MEPIKDLDLLVNDGEKIAKFAKLFARLPEILQALASAEGYLKEMEKKKQATSTELTKIEREIEHKKLIVSELNHTLDALNAEAKETEKQMKKDVGEAKKKAQSKLEEVYLFNEKAIQEAMDAANKEMDRQREMLKKGESEMQRKLKEYDDSIQRWSYAEKEAIAKAEKARKQLAEIAARIGG